MEYEVLAESGGEVTQRGGRGSVSLSSRPTRRERLPGDVLLACPAARPSRSSLDAIHSRAHASASMRRGPTRLRAREQGRRTARENFADLVDDGTFVEYGPLVFAAQERRRSREELMAPRPPMTWSAVGIDGSRRCVLRLVLGTQACERPQEGTAVALAERRACRSSCSPRVGAGGRGCRWPLVAGPIARSSSSPS